MERQVLITVKCFGAYGNDIFLYDVANWAGIRYGIVDFITQRVIIAIFDINLRVHHICWPIEEEKECAKE